MNRKRKHPLEAQADKDWAAGLFVMATSIVCAFLLGLPTMSRARFNEPTELEREPIKNVKPAQSVEKSAENKEN